MDNSVAISLGALIVSILALPMSYFVATKQVKVGLDEHERRVKNKTILLVSENLEDLFSLFFSAAETISGIDKEQLMADFKKIEPHIDKIENLVMQTGIINRIASSIDEYTENNISNLNKDSDSSTKLKMIRGLANSSSDQPGLYIAWKILNICEGGALSANLKKQAV